MSDSNSAAGSSETSKELECEVCNVPFDTKSHCPRILLKCRHTICEQCAEKLWNQGRKLYIRCPFDRKLTYVKDDINNLPKNFKLERLLETMKAEGVSVPPIPFGRCSKDPSHEAWFTCEECESDFCESCFDSKHCSSELSAHKKLPSIDKVYEAKKCKQHPNNFADFVCQDSECGIECKVICNVCLLEDHKDHEYGRIEGIVAENQKKLKEELIKKPVSEETQLFLDSDIPKKVNLLKRQMAAIEKRRKIIKKKLVEAHKAMPQYEDAKRRKAALETIRSEMRHRLNSKRKLEDVEDLVERHKKTREELNKKRSTTSNIRSPRERTVQPPLVETEVVDPDEPSNSSTSATPPTPKFFPIFKRNS